jgi:nucleoid DNA-binding protein
MIKEEVVEKISSYFRLTSFEAEKIYDDIFFQIMTGVKDDNIVDITNFGEFIIKYNNGKGNGNEGINLSGGTVYKRSVEFLSSAVFEEEFNRKSYVTTHEIREKYVEKPHEDTSGIPEEQIQRSKLEDEMQKKRQEILSKLAASVTDTSSVFEEEKALHDEISEAKTEEPPVVQEQQKPPETESPEPDGQAEVGITGESKEQFPELQGEDISKKSFSDYFSQVDKSATGEQEIHEPEPPPAFIPPAAVELHKEIVQPQYIPEPQVVKPAEEVVTDEHAEHKASDNSYYIWYKDAESTPAETQNLSYEYELLYQATKEAEYKSKLKIYVTTFILFFSLVLVLLIFSPIMYRAFFTPEAPVTTTQVAPEYPPIDQLSEQKAAPNVVPPVSEKQVNPPAADTTKKIQAPPVAEEQKQVQHTQPPVQEKKELQKPPEQKQTPPPEKKQTEVPTTKTPVEAKIEGVTQNSMGWLDDTYKVLYIKLDNGKYTIQESAWDSEAKANKRLTSIDGLKIAGLKGSIIKADLGVKGIWFRARFGEFSSIKEAREKAKELRQKEKVRLHALLLTLIMYT